MNVVARAALGFAAMLLALGTAASGHLDPGPGGCCTKPSIVAAAPATLRSTTLAAR